MLFGDLYLTGLGSDVSLRGTTSIARSHTISLSTGIPGVTWRLRGKLFCS